jgi:BTB/POZ domain
MDGSDPDGALLGAAAKVRQGCKLATYKTKRRDRFRDNQEFTDLVLRHGTVEFKVHKVIVCSQSPVLYKGWTGGFKVRRPHFAVQLLGWDNRKPPQAFTT